MTGEPVHDKRIFRNITELAVLLDRPRRRCFDQVAAAMPKDEQTQTELRRLTACMGQAALPSEDARSLHLRPMR